MIRYKYVDNFSNNKVVTILKPIVAPFVPIPIGSKGRTTMPIMFIPIPLRGIVLKEYHCYPMLE
jgi:hypothetical protein